jgi:fatty acid-binding protein DegV
MSVGLLSDEVAEDYKNSLEDLTLNSRYEISNLTVIAKENTEHAMQISRVLENHIRNVSIGTRDRSTVIAWSRKTRSETAESNSGRFANRVSGFPRS